MSDLTEFLLARIAEDEVVARLADSVTDKREDDWQDVTQPLTLADTLKREPWSKKYGYAYEHIARHDPARVLAECEAKRHVVAIHHPHEHHGEHGAYAFCDACQWDHGDDSPRIDMGIEEFGKTCPTLRALAAVYADHPDYREEWKP